jgi:hypothetical protein
MPDMPLPDLDLYLAHGFRHSPLVWSQLAARGADLVAAERVWQRVCAGDTRRIEDLRLATYTALYGAPNATRSRMSTGHGGSALVPGPEYAWTLSLWPAHEWVCVDVGRAQIVVPVGLKRTAPDRPTRLSPLSMEAASAVLRIGHHTVDDVRAVLGTPQQADGWSPEDEFGYDLPDGSVLKCVLVHGLLAALHHLSERPADWPSRV